MPRLITKSSNKRISIINSAQKNVYSKDIEAKLQSISSNLHNATLLIEWLTLNTRLSHDPSLPEVIRTEESFIREIYEEIFRNMGWL
jgi:hypothetical protein